MAREGSLSCPVALFMMTLCGPVARGEYGPHLSRFVQRDPLERKSCYVYVDSSPSGHVDPSGLMIAWHPLREIPALEVPWDSPPCVWGTMTCCVGEGFRGDHVITFCPCDMDSDTCCRTREGSGYRSARMSKCADPSPRPPLACPSVPNGQGCPSDAPGSTVGDGWCREGYNPFHRWPGGNASTCYRGCSYGRTYGSQCCYDSMGCLIGDGASGSGTADSCGPSDNEDSAGNCLNPWPLVFRHIIWDVLP
jgi:hypothetical protein